MARQDVSPGARGPFQRTAVGEIVGDDLCWIAGRGVTEAQVVGVDVGDLGLAVGEDRVDLPRPSIKNEQVNAARFFWRVRKPIPLRYRVRPERPFNPVPAGERRRCRIGKFRGQMISSYRVTGLGGMLEWEGTRRARVGGCRWFAGGGASAWAGRAGFAGSWGDERLAGVGPAGRGLV